MSIFNRPFDPNGVNRIDDLMITFPQTPRLPEDPPIRPGIARHAASQITLLHVSDKGSPFLMSPPVTGTARIVNISSPLVGNVSQLIEISMLPFSNARTLREFAQGIPTFYIGYSSTSPYSVTDDDILRSSEPIASVTGDAYIGVLFQDRVSLAPWAWIEIIRARIESTDPEGAQAWNSLSSLYAGVRSVRILDHVGNTCPNQNFQIRIVKADGNYDGPWTRTTGADGDLEQSAVINPLTRSTGEVQASLFGSNGEQTELLWSGNGSREGVSIPVQYIYETNTTVAPGQPLLLPLEIVRCHVETIDLSKWFARPSSGIDLPHYHTSSRVEPIVDGIPTFKRIINDLERATGNGNGAHFAGWAFKNFKLDPDREDRDTLFTSILKDVIDNGGDVRFLMNKFVNFKPNSDFDTDAKRAAAIVLIAITNALLIFSGFRALTTDSVGFLVVLGGYLLSQLLISSKLLSVSSLIEKAVEQSLDIFEKLNQDFQKKLAVWSQYPMRLIDNPAALTPLPLDLDDYIDQFGSWHQKIQLMKMVGEQYVAYLGGIDINDDRLDTPTHQIKTPLHDVHARVTGPAAADIFRTWHERYLHDTRNLGSEKLPPVFEPPSPEMLALQDRNEKDIVQIARTYYKPNPVEGTSDLYPSGDTGINDTLIKAISSAREYIYIEDQYFTPNDSQPPSSAKTYFDALLDAATSNFGRLRLIIIIPTETDQPFGDLRRRYLLDRLQSAWHDRMIVCVPLRRPILPNPGRITSEGRCTLMRNIIATEDNILIGPQARVPQTTPFWIWINGELMLSRGTPTPAGSVDSIPSMNINVLRGQQGTNPRWGAEPRAHYKGDAVTMAQLKGIYVHAKVMMIDDIFLSIGSANINRRGLLSDGEINVFAIPENLKSSRDNPVLKLRTALWAEHLGLSASMGRSLLKDPSGAFDLFWRSMYQGNRVVPFNVLDLKPDLGIPLGDAMATNLLSASIIGWQNSLIPLIWNDISDPTSYNDPQWARGPIPT